MKRFLSRPQTFQEEERGERRDEGEIIKEAEILCGVVSASEPILEENMEDINQSVRLLEELGINVKFGKYAFSNPTGYRRDSEA